LKQLEIKLKTDLFGKTRAQATGCFVAFIGDIEVEI
jgi:hypothetical protein